MSKRRMSRSREIARLCSVRSRRSSAQLLPADSLLQRHVLYPPLPALSCDKSKVIKIDNYMKLNA